MKLYICEKPSQGRDLAKILGLKTKHDGFIGNTSETVTWGIGHMLELSNPEDYDLKWKNWTTSIGELPCIPDVWKMKPNPKTKKQLQIIKSLLNKADTVVVATDGDREGETIGRELLDYYDYSGNIQRLWLNALDDDSIKRALDNIKPGSETLSLYHAGLARSRADWIVGLNLTRLVTTKSQMQGYQGVLSIGRVQTPTLKIVVDRDTQIENFVAKDYYEIFGYFEGIKAKWSPANTESNNFDGEERLISLSYANNLVSTLNNATTAIIAKYETTRKKVPAPLLYSLSSLQQEASKKFGLSAKQVLDIAQNLYEKHKATTYPRTDCNYLPESQFSEAKQVTNALSHIWESNDEMLDLLETGCDIAKKSRVFNDKKITAHHGMIPTMNTNVSISEMTDNEFKVYDLIVRSYIAQFYPNYEYDKTDIEFNVKNESFEANINNDIKLGWKKVLTNKDIKTSTLPVFNTGDMVNAKDFNVACKQTTPPARFTEGSLIAAMENVHLFIDDDKYKKVLKGNEGIGTEATRANIIETLKSRGFLETKKKQIVSTNTGRELVEMLPDVVTNPITTAIIETYLDKIVSNEITIDDFISRQIEWLNSVIGNINQGGLNIASNVKTHPCPTCGKTMYEKKGKTGSFFACSDYPICKTTAPSIKGKPVFEADLPDCPKCGRKLIKRKGKKGYFWGCRGYFEIPKCDFITQDKSGKPVL